MSERSWRVELAPAAQRQLRKLPSAATARLRGPILALGLDPWPAGAARLVGSQLWRLRVGDVRIVYAVDEASRTVVIVRVARRSESTYRRVR